MRHVVVMEGPPLCGKSYQATLLEEKFGYFRVEAGDILRGYPGLADIIKEGDLAPNDEAIGAISQKLPRPLPGKVVFSGFPRSVEQAEWLKELVDAHNCQICVVMMSAPQSILLGRVLTRQKEEKRADDNPKTVENRFNRYKEYGPKIRSFFCKQYPSQRIHWIDAASTRDCVTDEIQRLVTKDLVYLNKTRSPSAVHDLYLAT